MPDTSEQSQHPVTHFLSATTHQHQLRPNSFCVTREIPRALSAGKPHARKMSPTEKVSGGACRAVGGESSISRGRGFLKYSGLQPYHNQNDRALFNPSTHIVCADDGEALDSGNQDAEVDCTRLCRDWAGCRRTEKRLMVDGRKGRFGQQMWPAQPNSGMDKGRQGGRWWTQGGFGSTYS
ncbi:uncharacterized protein PV07_09195 [Cladophialophora immunda]|uniref:Uncharacterized protein n=1 Tax=Cladophialophora immunda TaxID=569365 RepID=A0A0D2ALX5_9EURO|nr:uncharacterized protein PV07_09195 [Cladophialophora immunda]KIW26067.1 hypothetical protein PV07_09195 [Cladophialophora immunda]